MKIRNGFVSNSSSSSFVLKRRRLKEWQEEAVVDHLECSKKLLRWSYDEHCDCTWEIEVKEDVIEGNTSMDNFPMQDFFEALGIPAAEYSFEEGHW